MSQIETTDATPIFVDAKGLKCPMPVIKLQQQARVTRPGSLILIACTDPGAEKDIGSWCKVNKHEILEVKNSEHGCEIRVKVQGPLQNQT